MHESAWPNTTTQNYLGDIDKVNINGGGGGTQNHSVNNQECQTVQELYGRQWDNTPNKGCHLSGTCDVETPRH